MTIFNIFYSLSVFILSKEQFQFLKMQFYCKAKKIQLQLIEK